MPTTPVTSQPAKRAKTVISIPNENNRIYGDDVPMPWREAARQTGIPANSFWLLLQSRQIEKHPVGKRVMVTPSAIRAYPFHQPGRLHHAPEDRRAIFVNFL